MPLTVGAKGQVVIAKEIRDRLGIGPGWIALERLVDDHVEIRFVPPEHNESLYGSLARETRVRVPLGDAWHAARERAWTEHVSARFGRAGQRRKRS